jgi:hypothetical protein
MGSACRKAGLSRLQEGGIVETELFEVARFAHRQVAGQVAIHDMLVLDVLAIHPSRLDCHDAPEVNKSGSGKMPRQSAFCDSGSGILPRPSCEFDKRRGFCLLAAAGGGGVRPCTRAVLSHVGRTL